MRVLLDECLPRRLKHELAGHEVVTVPERGWAGVKNGELVRRAADEFDVFITVDQGLRFQQNLAAASTASRLAVLVLRVKSNRLEALRPLAPRMLTLLGSIAPGQVEVVSPDE